MASIKLEHCFVKPGVFNLPESDWWGFTPDESTEIESHWQMAHIAVAMGLFPSAGQARKNGWDGAIPEGFTQRDRIGKFKMRLFIHNPPQQFIDDPNWGKVP